MLRVEWHFSECVLKLCSGCTILSDSLGAVSKDKRPMSILRKSEQRSLFSGEGYKRSCNLFLCTLSNPLANNWGWIRLGSPKVISSSPPLVSFSVISHPHHNARCSYRYFLSRARIHHAIQLNSKSNLESTSFGSTGYAFLVSNRILMEPNGTYLFYGSYPIIHSLCILWVIPNHTQPIAA